MLRKLANILLLIAIIVLMVGLFREMARNGELVAEEERLAGLVGRLAVDDESQMHLALVRSDPPFDYYWRLFLPEKSSWTLRREMASSGGGSSGFSLNSAEQISIRCRLLFDADSPSIMHLSEHGSSTHSISPKVAAFLSEHADELRMDVAGDDGQVSSDPDDAMVKLLMLYVPDSLLDEHGDELPPNMKEQLRTQPLMQVLLGEPTRVDTWFDEQRKRQREAKLGEN